MEMRFYLRIIKRGWWLILIAALVAVNFSLIYSYYLATPTYEAVARFIVSPNIQSIESRDLVNSLEALDKRSIISTYAEVLNSHQIISDTLSTLNVDPTQFSAYTTYVTVLPDANIIRFSVQGPDPKVAAILANGIGQRAIDFISNLYVIYNIEFLDQALVPTVPIQPKPLQNASLALLVGIVVGVGLAIFRDQLSSTLDRLGERNKIDYESLAFSRAYFERMVRQEMSSQPESVLTFGIIHLNGMQDFYDSLPQTYINKIMRHVAETLKYQLRGTDIVGRWSNLEFGILLPSTDGVSAEGRMMRVRQVLDRPFSLDAGDETEICLDAIVGLADRQGGESLALVTEQAQKALDVAM
ncbi:MAG TPA: Wzz/FepE/Etk N-terminal domain-containing protein, partial [Anaerolineales bacterium]|nr:Wzz/FepE/Etk N-terminal domain-containing protein [Anaerolineales bacterium]